MTSSLPQRGRVHRGTHQLTRPRPCSKSFPRRWEASGHQNPKSSDLGRYRGPNLVAYGSPATWEGRDVLPGVKETLLLPAPNTLTWCRGVKAPSVPGGVLISIRRHPGLSNLIP